MKKQSANSDIANWLREEVLLFDGAMGTEICRHNIFTNRNFDELCLSEPELILGIHRDYLEAGADVITTNSFGANRLSLGRSGFAEKVCEINTAAARLARKAAGASNRRVGVAGSVGPLPGGMVERPERVDVLTEQIRSLSVDGAVDFILFETLSSRQAAEEAVEAYERCGVDVPFVVSYAVGMDGESVLGARIERLLADLPGAHRPAAWGLNCGVGPDAMLDIVERAVRCAQLPVIVQPNAGSPKDVDFRTMNLCTPEYLATYARRYVNLGARAVGGCCGTTPAHIREVGLMVKPLARAQSRAQPVVATKAEVPLKDALPLAERSRWGGKLARGEWVSTVELLPPRGYDLRDVVAKARLCHAGGADAVNIPDGPRASARIAPLTTAIRIQREAGIEAILHFCCRDRNLISMQADLLACAAEGVRNILFVTGDPPKLGHYSHASGVFDTDSIGMARIQARMNCGVDMGGESIEPATAAVIGVGADPSAVDFDREVRRFREKADAGAEFAITQPVFTAAALFRFLDAVRDVPIPIVAGIWPLASYRNAIFLKNEVPGVVVPDAILDRLSRLESRDDQRKAGIDLARAIVAEIRARVRGIQVSAPFGNVQTALAVMA